ncbi:hypothetical protein [Actinophytocola sp.]|uniref:hypothetical protein n=1 Tax=Actinophytocola sp. TaxID=1872138 RepID=UPI002ED52EF3
MAARTRVILTTAGFVLAAAAVGLLAAFIEAETGQTWPKWPLLAAVAVPAVIVLLRHTRSSGR